MNDSKEEKQKTTAVRITKLSFVLLTSALLVLSSIAAAQLVLVTTNNNNAAYGQPTLPSRQCESGFTFKVGAAILKYRVSYSRFC